MSRFAPVIHGLYPDASRNAYCRRVTEKPLALPDGSVFQYSPKTLSKWVSLYQNGGIDALMPRERSDKGSTRALPDTAVEEIYRLREATGIDEKNIPEVTMAKNITKGRLYRE